MGPVVTAAFWAPFAVLLHIALHEASHLLVGTRQGKRLAQFHPWPGYFDGHFYWGWTRFAPYLEQPSDVWMWCAPAGVEFPWAILSAVAVALTPAASVWHWLAIVECLAAMVDLGNWCRSAWLPQGDVALAAAALSADIATPRLAVFFGYFLTLTAVLCIALPWGVV